MSDHAQSIAEPMVVIAGAGVSAAPPSSLPSWLELNGAILRGLANHLGDYTRDHLGEQGHELLLSARDVKGGLPPSFMADIIEEECGLEYFTVLQAVDIDATNPCHDAIAKLAMDGRLAAIITTNFDRLIEIALTEIGMPHRVHADPNAWGDLPSRVSGLDHLPVIKIHGTVEHPETMVDTERQRLTQRPLELEAFLRSLYENYHLLFVGFSGADLDHDRRYLGLLDAAEAAKGFTYVQHKGHAVRPAIAALKEAWGPKATIVEGILPNWLGDMIGAEPPPQGTTKSRLPAVEAHAGEWANRMHPYQMINVMIALLRAGRNDAYAGEIMYRAWLDHRHDRDMFTPMFTRFRHKLGAYLLEYGWSLDSVGQRIGYSNYRFRQGDASNVTAWGQLLEAVGKSHSRDGKVSFRVDDSLGVPYPPARPDLAVCEALMGNLSVAIHLLTESGKVASDLDDPLLAIDTSIGIAYVYAIVGAWDTGLDILWPMLNSARYLGYQTRVAQLCAHLVRFLAREGLDEAARRTFEEGVAIADRLGLVRVKLQLDAAWGLSLSTQGRDQEAVPYLRDACLAFRRSGRNVDASITALDFYRAAVWARDQTAFDEATTQLGPDWDGSADASLAKLGERIRDGAMPRGLLPYREFVIAEGLYVDIAEGLYVDGIQDLARDHARDTVTVGKALATTQGNRWVEDLLDKVAQALPE